MPRLAVSGEVQAALGARRAVVALESSLIAQGLPAPYNLATALAAEAAVRAEGAVPATVALDDGWLRVGASRDLLERLADSAARPAKAASRDLAPLLGAGRLASTTVSATLRAARMAGINLLATGGIGGVHRGWQQSHDISGDIDELAVTRLAVVCSGAKSILDLPATLELLETRRVTVIGIGTDEMPAFYSASSGLPLAHRVEDAAGAAIAIGLQLRMPGASAMLFVQPPPAELALPFHEVEAWIGDALREASAKRVRGSAVTPFVLARVAEQSGGRTLETNIGLIVNNARTAARIAVALAAMEAGA